MIHWFIKRRRRGTLLLAVPVMVLAFILLNTARSTQSSEQAENSDDGIGKAYEEVFSAINPADVYIQWDMPKSTATEGQYDSVHSDWFLGAYKSVSEYGSDGVSVNETLCVALDRTMLPISNLEYTIHYFDAENSFLFLDLLAANGLVIAENLYGNLLDGSGEDRVISLDVPLAHFPDAAVIQLRCGAGEATVYESRIYACRAAVVVGASALDSGAENSNGVKNTALTTTGIAEASTPRSMSDCYSHDQASPERFAHAGNGNPDSGKSFLDSRVCGNDREEGIIYVDQSIGDDGLTGRLRVVSGQDGPKRTIRNGLTVADDADTLIIKSGVYNENLDIKDRNVNVLIEGNVRL